jgi:large subunit ribosomal protein L20
LTNSQINNLLNKKGITLDRKILADLAMNNPESFTALIAQVK